MNHRTHELRCQAAGWRLDDSRPGQDGRAMPRPSTRDLHAGLPEPMRDAVDEFARHLAAERNRSAHTVRAYVADVVSLLDHAVRMGVPAPDGLVIGVLRSWLARLRSAGAARTSLARRAASARTFTAWAHRDGRLARDVGASLSSPKAQRPLPSVLRTDQAETLVTGPAIAGGPGPGPYPGPAAGDEDPAARATRLRD